MRSYEETIRRVHSRIAQYEAEQKTKRERIAGAAAAVTPVCLAAAVGIGLWRSGAFAPADMLQVSEPAVTPVTETVPSGTLPQMTAAAKNPGASGKQQTAAEPDPGSPSADGRADAGTKPAEAPANSTDSPAEAAVSPADTPQSNATAVTAEKTAPVTKAGSRTITTAKTAPVTEAGTRAVTGPAKTETVPAKTTAAAEQQIYEPGDVDMDGKITYVDAALVFIDVQLASYDRMDLSLLSDEQRALGNVDGQTGCWNHWYWDAEKQDYAATGSEFPLNHTKFNTVTDERTGKTESVQMLGDDDAIFNVACYRKFLGLSDLTAAAYLAKPDYYDALYQAWCRTADAETLQHSTDLQVFYWQLRQALTKTKKTNSDAWTGSFRQWLENSVYLDDDVLYDAEWFRENAEIMRAYF